MLLGIEGVVQRSKTDCGPSALYMILRHLGYTGSRDSIEQEVCSDGSGVTYTIGLARAAAYLGFSVLYFTKSLALQFPDKPYKYTLVASVQQAKEHVDSLTNDCFEYKIPIEERVCDTEEMKIHIEQGWYCIVLCERNQIENVPYEKYRGHFLVVVGWNDEFLYLYDVATNPTDRELPILTIPYTTFRSSREQTDRDIVFIKK